MTIQNVFSEKGYIVKTINTQSWHSPPFPPTRFLKPIPSVHYPICSPASTDVWIMLTWFNKIRPNPCSPHREQQRMLKSSLWDTFMVCVKWRKHRHKVSRHSAVQLSTEAATLWYPLIHIMLKQGQPCLLISEYTQVFAQMPLLIRWC